MDQAGQFVQNLKAPVNEYFFIRPDYMQAADHGCYPGLHRLFPVCTAFADVSYAIGGIDKKTIKAPLGRAAGKRIDKILLPCGIGGVGEQFSIASLEQFGASALQFL